MAKASLARVEEDPELDQEFRFYFNCDWYPLQVLKMEWKWGDLIQLTFKNIISHFDFTSLKPNFSFRTGQTTPQPSLFAQAVCGRRRLVCTRRPAFDSPRGVCDSWQAQ